MTVINNKIDILFKNKFRKFITVPPNIRINRGGVTISLEHDENVRYLFREIYNNYIGVRFSLDEVNWWEVHREI